MRNRVHIWLCTFVLAGSLLSGSSAQAQAKKRPEKFKAGRNYGILLSEALGKEATGKEAWKWKMIFSNLMDWCCYLGLSGYSHGSVMWCVLEAYSPEVQTALARFQCALHPSSREYAHKAGIQAPFVSEKARTAFLHLLQTLDAPVLIVGGSWGPRESSYYISDDPVRQKERHFTQEQALTEHKRLQDQALEYCAQFENFVKKYPQDRYLGGYAALSALFLRMKWSKDDSFVLNGLQSLEQTYSDVPEIGIMAAWYRADLLDHLKRKEAKSSYLTLAEKYQRYRWWVVEEAKRRGR